MNNLSLDEALEIINYAKTKAVEISVPVCVAVVDIGGHLIAFERMDGAILASIDISINKAFTSVMLKMSTDRLSEIAMPGEDLYGINTTNNCKIVIFGGGYPIYMNNNIIGGIGVSGGSTEQDMTIAKTAIEMYSTNN
jgi:uncharacterized protein GlcG (DUF336 family)